MKTGRALLSQLEQAVLTQMARGYKPGAIQMALGISRKHYSKVRDSILNKTGATNDFQAGMFCNQQQLVSTDERNRIEDRREVRLDALRSAP